MIVFDTNALLLLIDRTALPHIDRACDRIDLMIKSLESDKEAIVVPTPVLAELVAGRAERIVDILSALSNTRRFIVQPFDQVIAIETGLIIERWRSRLPADQGPATSRAAMKFDAQIAATARVLKARAICTDDGGYGAWIKPDDDIEILRLSELPLPPDPPQPDFFHP